MLRAKAGIVCRIRNDVRLFEIYRDLRVEKEYQDRIDTIEFNRFCYRIDGSSTMLVITTDITHGRVLFSEIATRDAIFTTCWLNGQPDFETIHIGIYSNNRGGWVLDSQVPAHSGPPRSLTETRITQLKLELGDIQFPCIQDRALERAVVSSIDGEKDPVRTRWSIVSTAQGLQQFKVANSLGFFMDPCNGVIRYSVEDMHATLSLWVIKNLSLLTEPRIKNQ